MKKPHLQTLPDHTEKHGTTAALLHNLSQQIPVTWINPALQPFTEAQRHLALTIEDITDASQRLERFRSYLLEAFPETEPLGGLIESPLVAIPDCQRALSAQYPVPAGRLLLKMDSHLAISGSVKARGGIYEVLKHAETLAINQGIISVTDDYRILTGHKAFFSQYKIQVGSTGNLGLSIGITGARLGFQVIVHMSADARQWKKDLLRSHGVTVREYTADYGKAVEEGRKLSEQDPASYFIDDEHSTDLYLGYAVAAERLQHQLLQHSIKPDKQHPLFVYLPCGVGGAPGGITFGLKQLWGDAVHCIFVEPTGAPCMTLGLASGQHDKIAVQDIGLSGKTCADGLAVGRPSGLVSREMQHLISGCVTVQDAELFKALQLLYRTENIFIEPSASAAFAGYQALALTAFSTYLQQHNLHQSMPDATHILWATGGSMVPDAIRTSYLQC